MIDGLYMFFSEKFLGKFDWLMKIGFVAHDIPSDFLAKYLKQVKIGLLLVAHASLLGLLSPQPSKEAGEFARNLLFVIVLTSPLAKLFRMKLMYQIMSLRRELGIWFAYLAIVHGVGYALDPDWFSVFIAPYAAQPTSILPRYLFGISALLLTLPLLLTSNNLATRILKGNWKRVHWLTYPMFAFVLLHSFLPDRSGFANALVGWLQFAIVFGGYILLKMLAQNNFLIPLREVNEYVGRKYKEYKA